MAELSTSGRSNEEGTAQASTTAKAIGLETAEARRSLLDALDTAVKNLSPPFSWSKVVLAFLARFDSIVLLISVALLVTFFVYMLVLSSTDPPFQLRSVGSLVVAVILLFQWIMNLVSEILEARINAQAFERKIRAIADRISSIQQWESIDRLKCVPVCSSISSYLVWRDNCLRRLPAQVLVTGDVVELALQDKPPCRVYLRDHPECVVSQGQLLTRAVMEPLHALVPLRQGRLPFVLAETPIVSYLASQTCNLHASVISRQWRFVNRIILNWMQGIVIAITLLINGLRVGLVTGWSSSWMELLFVLTVNPSMPLMPLMIPTLFAVMHFLGLATIFSLFDQLQKSKTPYEETVADQFDTEAPPPVKDVPVSWRTIFRRFLKTAFGAHRYPQDVAAGLLTSVANTTVVAVIDKEGIPFETVPMACEVVFFKKNELVTLELEFIESNGKMSGHFKDRQWETYLPSLKPLGLNFVLNTNCHVFAGDIKRCNHVKSIAIPKPSSARQACQHYIGKLIGFAEGSTSNFHRLKEIHVIAPEGVDTVEHYLAIYCGLFKGPQEDQYQLLSEGDLESVLATCSDIWDGEEVRALTESEKGEILENHSNCDVRDLSCLAYSYRPVEALEAGPVLATGPDASYVEMSVNGQLADANPLSGLLSNQVFIGMVYLEHHSSADYGDFIESLGNAGIHYVYFSQKNENQTKALADRLGIETDWNACISLTRSNKSPARSHLPIGIENIRPHLATVDDVPLHVPLFVDCTPAAVDEMIRIFQEHGEVVTVFGSCLHAENANAFATADLAVAMDVIGRGLSFGTCKTEVKPATNRNSTVQANSLMSFLSDQELPEILGISSSLTALSCAFNVNYETSPYAWTEIIRAGRRLVANIRQAFQFVLAFNFALVLLFLLSYAMLLGPVLEGFHVTWLLFVIQPILTVPFIFTPPDPDVMLLMPPKNVSRWNEYVRGGVMIVCRILFPVFACLAVYIIAFYDFVGLSSWSSVFGGFPTWLTWSESMQWSVIYSETCVNFLFGFYFALISVTYHHRNLSFVEFPPWRNVVGCVAVLLAIVLQIVFSLVSFLVKPSYLALSLGALSWYAYVVAFASLLLILPMQEFVKYFDRRRFLRNQKRAKLVFNTKLGMHSPVQ